MKKLAFLMTLILLCSTLAAPLSAASSSEDANASQSSSESSSSKEDGSSSGDESSSSAPEEETPAGSPGATTNQYALPVDMPVYSKAIYLLNLDSGTVLYEDNAQIQMPLDDLAKIMTCIVALESDIDLDNEKTDLKTYIQNELYNIGGGNADGIRRGESLSIRDLLYGMMLQSGDSAAMMVADYISESSPEYFFELMNKKAREIGAYNTNFANATGIYNEDGYTTAYDMALITRYAMEQVPGFEEIVTTRSHTSQPTELHPNGITWVNYNSMQNPTSEEYFEGLKGVMFGVLPGQQIRSFASTASRNGYTYLLVCMGAPMVDESGAKFKNNLAWRDTRNFYNWALGSFTVKTLMDVGDPVGQVNVKLSWDHEFVRVLAAEKFASLVPNEVTSENVEPVLDVPEYINAPVEKGQEVGSVRLMLSGVEVGRIPVVAEQAIDDSAALYYLDKVKQFCNKFIFKFIITFVIIVLVLYIGLMVLRNHNRRRYKGKRRRSPQAKK